ncbi:hypothetical protein ACQJBY_001653 [Aegilops geniculata]
MAGASDDPPGRPPSACREAESDDEAVSPSAYLISGDSGREDEEQSTRVVVPPPPPQDPRAMNVMDAYRLFLERQERELSVHLRGQAAKDYARGLPDGGSAAGEEKEVSSPWRFVNLSDLIVPQPPAPHQPTVRAGICRACRRWIATIPRVPYRHVCFCVPCRYSRCARICCSVCGAGRRLRRRSSKARATGRPQAEQGVDQFPVVETMMLRS